MRPFAAASLALALGAAAPGCGMVLDLDPPDDAATGMDAGHADAGGPSCTIDEDCDDSTYCNGSEICELGECAPGRPVICDDGIECTVDRCDEASERCGAPPDDSLCAAGPTCVGAVCDPYIGCRPTFDASACDDGVPCTVDLCTLGAGCEHVPDDGSCLPGEYCDAAGGGCMHPSPCTDATDCAPRRCNRAPVCYLGVCRYEPMADGDPRCTASDPCVPATCVVGACVIGPRVTCVGLTDPASCERSVCIRSPTGTADCGNVDRNGEGCSTGEPCTYGTCDMTSCVPTSTCTPVDACERAMCASDGTCHRSRVPCGPNARCSATSGGPSCVCNVGFTDCNGTRLGCECPVATSDGGMACSGPTGWADCSGDGACDCDPSVSRCVGMACVAGTGP